MDTLKYKNGIHDYLTSLNSKISLKKGNLCLEF